MLKLNRKKTISLTLVGLIFALVALIIFMFLPTSDIANGINYSAESAIFLLAVSPVASLISLVCFIFALIKDFNVWSGVLSKGIVISALALFSLMGICNFAIYLSYFILQVSLGFVAPYTGTAYECLAIVAFMVTLHKVLLTALSSVAVNRNI